MDKSNIYDLVIVGAGPAGITAAVYAARKKMDFIVITKDIGGQAAWSSDIENYTGYQFITGPELVKKFEDHMNQYDIGLKDGEAVVKVEKKGENIEVVTEKNTYLARTAIIATGKKTKELKVKGENKFKGKGVTYCATCDGPLFSGRDVAVIGGGNSALDAAIQLSKIASKVYMINLTEKFTGDPIMQEKVSNEKKIEVYHNSRVVEIIGDKVVTGIRIAEVDGAKGSIGYKTFMVKGIFIEIGLIPSSEFVYGVDKNERGEIIVNAENQSSVKGIYAAGDVTNVRDKQIIIAAGEGSKAALSAFRYLITNK